MYSSRKMVYYIKWCHYEMDEYNDQWYSRRFDEHEEFFSDEGEFLKRKNELLVQQWNVKIEDIFAGEIYRVNV